MYVKKLAKKKKMLIAYWAEYNYEVSPSRSDVGLEKGYF